MTKNQLLHILRAAAGITDETVFVVIGSQAILATHPDAPKKLRSSMEGDIYPKNAPDKADLIDGSIGEGSLFHTTFAYYAHGISPETATLPKQWEERLVAIKPDDNSNIVGLCLEKHDLAFSKLAAGREKDFDFLKEMLKQKLLNRGKLVRLIQSVDNAVLKEKLNRNWLIVTSQYEREVKPQSKGTTDIQ